MGPTEEHPSGFDHPFKDLQAFPLASAPTLQFRAPLRQHAKRPWWFCRGGECRFDLHPEGASGTCYLADDETGALAETVLRDAEPTGSIDRLPPLAPSEVAGRVMARIRIPQGWQGADLTGGPPHPPIWQAYGISSALGEVSDYERPQQWAQALHAGGIPGIRYRLRRANGRLGTAVFGPAGGNDGRAESLEEITVGSITEWMDGTASAIEPPTSADLDWL